MQGQRVSKPPHLLLAGEYTLTVRDADAAHLYYACTPNGLLANLARHTITENQDGTITVSPSILVNGESVWHGYLENGIWRGC